MGPKIMTKEPWSSSADSEFHKASIPHILAAMRNLAEKGSVLYDLIEKPRLRHFAARNHPSPDEIEDPFLLAFMTESRRMRTPSAPPAAGKLFPLSPPGLHGLTASPCSGEGVQRQRLDGISGSHVSRLCKRLKVYRQTGGQQGGHG